MARDHLSSRLVMTAAALIGFGTAALATSAPIVAHAGRAQVACQSGGSYNHLRMKPQTIAVAGSLNPSQSASGAVQAFNGSTCVAGVTVYLFEQSHVSGDTISLSTSQCSSSTVGTSPVACTTDSTGKVSYTYTSPSVLPNFAGVLQFTAENTTGSSGRFTAYSWYLYTQAFTFSGSPLAKSGSLGAGQSATDTLLVAGVGGTPKPGYLVYLALHSTASGGGSAAVGSTHLTTSLQPFTTDSGGDISITYTAPQSLPTSGTDTIIAQSSTSSTPGYFNSTSYAFSASTPTISVGDETQYEGDQHGPNEKGIYAYFDVSLSAPQASQVTVSYTTVCGIGDKTCQEDYLQTAWPRTKTVTIPAGSVSAQIPVIIYSYPAIESYDEGYFVQLLNPSGAILGRSLGTGTIHPDDETTTAQALYVGSGTVVCSDSGSQFLQITVTLSAPSNNPVSFSYSTADGSAVAGSDYYGISGTYTVPAGTVNAHLKITILPQSGAAAPKSFSIVISNSSGPQITQASGTGTIINWN